MTDKLNNLVETTAVELGGYYLAGDNDVWDQNLTKDRLYLIQKVVSSVDFYVQGDDGEETWVAMDCINSDLFGVSLCDTRGKLFSNPANV